MKRMFTRQLFTSLVVGLTLGGSVCFVGAQGSRLPIIRQSRCTARPIRRARSWRATWARPRTRRPPFPPHKIIGNIYYVGTKTLSSFLIVTPQGNILINSTYERNVPMIEKSVDDWGSSSPTSRSCSATTRTAIIRKATRWSSR